MNQNFSSEQLLKLCSQTEIIESGKSKEDLARLIDETFTNISNAKFDFNITDASAFYKTDDLIETLILRKLNDNLKRLYKDEQSNRRMIVNQVAVLLQENCPFWILRTDISSFYESINRETLLDKLQGDSMLSYFSIWLLKKLFAHPLLLNKKGLPRGIALSSTLSELYMRKFDRWIKSFNGVYYYARFVDDIIIFTHDKTQLENLSLQIEDNLEKGLTQNKGKTHKFNGNQINSKKALEYLGYKFTVGGQKNNKLVFISIADKKVNKIKSRIIYSFVDFVNNRNFSLLEKRIRFLTGNYSIRSKIDGSDLRAGIYYNYLNLNQPGLQVLNELNVFYQKTLHSKSHSFGRKVSQYLSVSQKDRLRKYSFKHGFKNKVYHSFSPSELKQISNCWK